MKTSKKIRRYDVRMREEDFELISRYAEEAGMSIANYMVMCSLHRTALTPEIMVRITNIVNTAVRLVSEIDRIRARWLQKEVNALWSLLS